MARWDRLTSPEIGEMIGGGMDLAVLPIGATEQHGGHLGTGTDTISADTVAARAAEEAGVIVLPAIPYGCSHGHTELWPGTLSLEPETLTAIILDVSRWAMRSGIRRFIYLSGHATNGPSIGSAILKLRYEHPESRFRQMDIWTISERVGQLYFRDAADFHANRGETSLLMHAAPELVRPDKIEDVEDVTPGRVFQYPMPRTTRTGAVGRPSEASTDDGREMMGIIVEDLAALLRQAFAEDWPPLP